MAGKAKKGGLSPRDLRMVLVLLGFVAIGCAYFFVFRSNSAKADEIKAQNVELQTTLDGLVAMENNRAVTEADTADKNAKVEDMLKNFPNEMTEEKMLSIVTEMEKKTKAVVPSVAFSLNQQFFPDAAMIAAQQQAELEAAGEGEGTEGAEGTEGTEEAAPAEPVIPEGMVDVSSMTGYDSTISISYQASYEQVKDMIQFINNYDDKMRIKSFSMTYNEGDGDIKGNMLISMYSVAGNTKEYVAPVVKDVKVGIDALFRVTEPVEEKEGN